MEMQVPIEKHTLENGVTVIMQHIPGVEVMTALVYVGVGAKHETDRQHGMSHILEHLCCGHDSRDMTHLEMMKSLALCGDHIYGEISRDCVRFGATVLPESLAETLRLLNSMVFRPALKEEDFAAEQLIIRNELLSDMDNSDHYSRQMTRRVAWAGQPFGRLPGGDPDTIMQVELADLRKFHRNRYVGRNTVVSIAGSLPLPETAVILDIVRDEFEGLRPGRRPAMRKRTAWTGGDFLLRKEQALVNCSMGWPAPGLSSAHRSDYRSRLLSAVLGEGVLSRLFKQVREKHKVYMAGSFKSVFADNGLLNIYLNYEPEKQYRVMDEVIDILRCIRQDIGEQEIEQQKSVLLKSYFEWSNGTWHRAGINAVTHLAGIDPIAPAEVVRIMKAITREEVMEFALWMLTAKPAVAVIGPVPGMTPAAEIQQRIDA